MRLALPPRAIDDVTIGWELLAAPPDVPPATHPEFETADGWPLRLVRSEDAFRAYYWFDGASIVATARGDLDRHEAALIELFTCGAPDFDAGMIALSDVWAGCEVQP